MTHLDVIPISFKDLTLSHYNIGSKLICACFLIITLTSMHRAAFALRPDSEYPSRSPSHKSQRESSRGLPELDKPSTSVLRPDVMGMRVFYGASSLEDQGTAHGAHSSERLLGSAVSAEWSLFHHHLELELIAGAFEHSGVLDEFGEIVLKLPLHLTSHADLLVGSGGVVETHHQSPQVGLTLDVNTRVWLDSHWGISTEIDYVLLQGGTRNTEVVLEVLYHF